MIKIGYSVTRWHTTPCLKPQTLAAHSWAVAMLLSRVFTGSQRDRLALIEAALEHDMTEGEIGDMPRPARTPEHRALEDRLHRQMGLRELPPRLMPWLEWADLMEAGLYAQREMMLGNQNFIEVSLRVAGYIQQNERNIPEPLWNFAKEAKLL